MSPCWVLGDTLPPMRAFGRGATAIFQSTEEMLRYSSEPDFEIPPASPASYPDVSQGLRRLQAVFDDSGSEYSGNQYVMMLLSALGIWATAGILDAGRVRDQLLRRLHRETLKEVQVATRRGLVPHWAIAPAP